MNPTLRHHRSTVHRHRISIIGLVGALALFAATSSQAEDGGDNVEPLVTDRPDFTESANSVAPRRVQLEMGYTFEKAGETEDQSFGEVLIRIGLVDKLELRLGLNSFKSVASPTGEKDGLPDADLGVKIETSQGSSEPSLFGPETALILKTSLPTGSSAFTEPHAQPGVTFALAWVLGGSLSLGSNLNLAYASDGGEQFVQGGVSFALGGELAPALSWYLEYYNVIPEAPHGDASHKVDGGLTYLFSPDFQIDWRVGTELDGEVDYFTGVGLSYRF